MSIGFGVIGELSTGYPGYDSVIGPESATIGEILKENGYATSWFGKDHNTPAFTYSTTAGPFDQWPVGMGFQYFYGFLGGETDQWKPYLFRNTEMVTPWVGHPGYNLITDMADDAIRYLRDLNASAPDKPFFLYYVPGGSHSPHQPTQEWIDKFHGKFDMGWEKMREQIFENQKKLGVIPPNTMLTPWPDGQAEYAGAKLPKWDSLSDAEKKMYAREAEVFAAYTAYTDYEIGRVIDEVQKMGKLDNTLIIYIDGDNGTSAEGSLYGTFNTLTAYNGLLNEPEVKPVKVMNLLHYNDWGSDKTYPHMAVSWTWAFDTPFKWTKQVASHFGGTRQGPGDFLARPYQRSGRDSHPVPPRDRHCSDHPRSRRHPGARRGQRDQAEADRGREHALHLRLGQRQCAFEARYAVLRDGQQPGHLSRWLDCRHHTARPGLGARYGCDASTGPIQVGALPHRGRLFGVQRPRSQESRQAEGAAGAVPERSGEVSGLPLGQPSLRAPADAPSQRDRRRDRFHVYRRESRHSCGQCSQRFEQGLHHHCGGDDPQRRRGGSDCNLGRPFRRLRAHAESERKLGVRAAEPFKHFGWAC